jgi:hypothetical protein
MRRIVVKWCLAGLAVLVLGKTSHAATGLTVETISDYNPYPGCNIPPPNCDVAHAHSNGDALWFILLTYPGTTYTALNHFQDAAVYDTDFFDPELTGTPSDNDTNNFDEAGTAISFAYGHGFCDDRTTTTCTVDQDCGPGAYCSRFGPLVAGDARTCIIQKVRGFATADNNPNHGNNVFYGKSYLGVPAKSFALGESANSGSFGGAGTNGGANVAVIVNSCGLRWNYWTSATTYMRAGVHSILMASPSAAWRNAGVHHFSDTVDSTNRGSELGYAIMNNINSLVKWGWLNPSMVDVGFVSTNAQHANGAHVMMASDVSSGVATWHINNETWANAKQDTLDAIGSGFTAGASLCNYDCATYGL